MFRTNMIDVIFVDRKTKNMVIIIKKKTENNNKKAEILINPCIEVFILSKTNYIVWS